MLYSFIKHILRFYFPLFFNKIHVEGVEQVPSKHPVIFAVNHQNTVLDATMVSYLLKKNTFFLVRSDIFKGKFINWIFKILYLIPISREQDGRGNMAELNKKTFAKCIEYLEGKKFVLIFPEGKSTALHQVSTFKKGVARLALEAEMKNDFKLDLHVIPVTINYQNHFKGNSDVWIKYCKPILLREYKAEYLKNSARTINTLLKEIASAVNDNVVKFDQHESSNYFFKSATNKSIQSTSVLMTAYESINNKSFTMLNKHKHSALFYVVRLVSKIIFFPSIIFMKVLNRIVNDADFKLSITSFSLLIFSLFQILLIVTVTTTQIGYIEGVTILLALFTAFIVFIKTYFTKS